MGDRSSANARTRVPRWLPNAISGARILLVPAWWAASHGSITLGFERAASNALLILTAIGISDVLDGFIARRFGLANNLGAALDAVSDKLAQITVLTTLAIAPPPGFLGVPIGFLVLLVLRDLMLVIGAVVIWVGWGRLQASHRWHGKASSLLMFVLMVAVHLPTPETLVLAGFGLAGGLLVFNIASYAYDGVRIMRSLPA